MWYELLYKLADVIGQANIVHEVKVGAYKPTNANVTDEGVILLMRGDETNKDAKLHNRVDMTFYIELWTRGDVKDLSDGHKRLHDLEMAFEEVFISYREKLGALDATACMLDSGWQIMDICVDTRRGDLDSIRPLIGSQYTVTASLYDATDESGIW